MKVQLLPSSFDRDGEISQRQHLSCFMIDDCVAFDAGSLAFSCSDRHRANVRDIFISHAHLDHIAGLPIFIDDLFTTLSEPLRLHATREVIQVLERDIFNWSVYPKFSELENSYGPVIEYHPFTPGLALQIRHLTFLPMEVNHNFASVGALISHRESAVGITGDTAHTDEIWSVFRGCSNLKAVLVECAFPNEMADLAAASHHLTPERLSEELRKFGRTDVPVYVVNIKAMYLESVAEQIDRLGLPYLEVLRVGRDYEF